MKNLLFVILCCSGSFAFSQTDDSALHFYNKGLEAKEARLYSVAMDQFEKAIEKDPKHVASYLAAANTAKLMRKLNLALKNYNSVIEIEPNNPIAIRELTQMYFDYRRYDDAIAFAKKCKDCENADRIIGMSLFAQENYGAAEKALLKALSKNSNDAEAAYTLGRNYLEMEAYKKAVPYYQKAIALDEDNTKYLYEFGLLQYNNAVYGDAVKAFELAAKHGYRQTNDFKENLGYAAIYNKEYDKGESLLLEVSERKGGSSSMIRDMADAFYHAGQYDRSLKYCQKLLEENPNDAKALYQAGLNFIKKGNKDRGQQMCDKAIAMDPSLEGLRKKKELQGL